MILRSITRHVKDQNWFAVWIDFAIVVVGVFIGIQVANWNDVQAERAQTQRMLGALVTDLSEAREQVVRSQDHHFNTTTAIDVLMTSLESGEQAKSDDTLATINRILGYSLLPGAPAGLDELLVTARLDLLDRASMRDALRNLAEAIEFREGAQPEYSKAFNAATARLLPYITMGRTPNSKGDQRAYQVSAVDIDAIWVDDQARLALTELYIFHSHMQALNRGYLRAIDAIMTEASKSTPEIS